MARKPAFNHPTCQVPNCGSHYYPTRPGPGRPHLFAEDVTPTPGDTQAVIYRVLHDDGRREAYQLRCDRLRWSDRLALPSRPRVGHEDAVDRARSFVRTGVLA